MSRAYHVTVDGDDTSTGETDAPLRTIGEAASRAEPGDEVVVHEGAYRERVDPPRGGTAEDPIVYRAAAGESVTLTGAEIVSEWDEGADCWRSTLPASFFGEYNPFAERIRGDWFDDRDRPHHTGAVYIDGVALPEAATLEDLRSREQGWYAEVGGETTIHARFGESDPREAVVEVNVRPAVFYPSEPGRDHVTVRGFTLCQAATQWAPPTTEQIGLLGTHWSWGWTIEDNVVHHSRCTGITLGKYGANVDDTGATADRYNETIRDAREHGWERGSVGGHVVRNNTIHHCEQAGIVGSMGAAFSDVSQNYIHHVNVEAQFGGAELAGIKFHGAVNTTIAHNHVHTAHRGIWLDWMAQGTRVTGNLLSDNRAEDLFVEVNHGPFVVDNNVCLSETVLEDWSQGGAYAHNLFAGTIERRPEPNRETPYLLPRRTVVAGLSDIAGGDDRFLNNVFVGEDAGLTAYDDAPDPIVAAGNVYLDDATPTRHEAGPVQPATAADLRWEPGDRTLSITVAGEWTDADTEVVTTDRLGSTLVSNAPFTAPDGTALRIDRDYRDEPRGESPTPGPIEALESGRAAYEL